jgi:4-amino-4-deoxy-L-arabinose transferase-like glycosyltransferase
MEDLADHPRHAVWVRAGAWCAAILLGLRELWHGRYHIVGDAISYLDIGDALAQGDWASAVNAYWSPMYAWVLGVAMRLAQPSPYWEFAVVAVVNFLTYLFALVCFHYLMTELVYYHRNDGTRFSASRSITFPEWAWLALGYSIFVWSSLHVLSISNTTPDMMLAGIVYLASALLLRIAGGDIRWSLMCALGASLGVGYLTKAPIFLLTPVFLTCVAVAIGNLRRALPRVALAAIVFALVAGPHVLAISRAKSRFTFGDAGRLNFAWDVNGVPRGFWLGGPPASGTPVNPPRQIHKAPDVFEFARPIRATYPPWHDPSYWFDGVTPYVDFPVTPLRESQWLYENLFQEQTAFIAGILVLYFLSAGAQSWVRDAISQWSTWVPAAAGLGLFGIAGAEGRYVGPFVALLMLAALSVVRLPDRTDTRRALVAVTIMMLLFLLKDTVVAAVRPTTIRETTNVNFEVADALGRLGVRRGDRLALLRAGGGLYWARLAGVQIVAEIPVDAAEEFWRADESTKRETLAAIARTNAKMLVAYEIPSDAQPQGWVPVGDSGWYAYPLQ